MKKILALALILVFFGVVACKKKDEQQDQQTAQQAGKTGEFKPKQKKNGPKGDKQQQAVPTSLKIYQDADLVKTVQQGEYPAIATTKVKVGPKDMNGITLKELLAKNNVKPGKSVTLKGQTMSAQLTWQQATSSDLYVYVTPKKFLKIQGGKSLNDVKFPKRLESITVNANEVAAKPPESKPASNQ
jgi:type III secretory pathway component EscV